MPFVVYRVYILNEDEIRAYWPWHTRPQLEYIVLHFDRCATALAMTIYLSDDKHCQYASSASERKPSVSWARLNSNIWQCGNALKLSTCWAVELEVCQWSPWHLRNLRVGINGFCLRFGCTCSSQLPCMDEVVETYHWIRMLNQEFENSHKMLAIHSISMESFDLFGLRTAEFQQFPTQHSLDRLRSRAKCIPSAQWGSRRAA